MVEAVRPSMDVGGDVGVGAADKDGEDEFEDSEFGKRETQTFRDPGQPTPAEKEEHEKTHIPFRSWCRHCVRGGGKELPHNRVHEHSTIPEVHLDFVFMGDEGAPGELVVILAARDRVTKMGLSTVVPSKSTGTFAAQRVMCFLREIGLARGDLIIKSDQEPAIEAIIKDVERLRGEASAGRTIVESSPVGSHQSNGIVERYAQEVEKQVRVMRDALEFKYKVKIDTKNPIIPWLVEHAGFLLNRCQVGKDGKTPYERCKGKPAKVPSIEFGEKILWRRHRRGDALAKMTCLWEDGVYLGVKGSTGEMKIGDERGVWQARSIQRKPLGDRWGGGLDGFVVGVPWMKNKNDPKADGEAPSYGGDGKSSNQAASSAAYFREPDVANKDMERDRQVVREPPPKRMSINKEDFEQFGYSARCKGCKAMILGKYSAAHSEECRARLEGELRGTERHQAAEKRMLEYLAKTLKVEDENRQKKARTAEAGDGRVQSNEGRAGSSSSPSACSNPVVEPRTDTVAEGDVEMDGGVSRGDKRRPEGTDGEVDESAPKRVMVGEVEVNQEEDEDWTEYMDDRTGGG